MSGWGDGDGWVHCARGHRHWGRFGAAGLFLTDGRRAVLQHRAPWTHEGATWGLPGGARDSHESAVQAALREAREEAALDAAFIDPIGVWTVDHGGWSYTTVVAQPLADLTPHAANAESTEIRWWDLDSVSGLPLHTGFAASWPALRMPAPQLALAVPPDLLAVAEPLRVLGVPTEALPSGLVETTLPLLLPHVIPTDSQPAGAAIVLRIGDDVPVSWLTDVLANRRSAESLGL